MRRFVDLVRVYILLIISRNHYNRFLLTDLQKTKICPTPIFDNTYFEINQQTAAFEI